MNRKFTIALAQSGGCGQHRDDCRALCDRGVDTGLVSPTVFGISHGNRTLLSIVREAIQRHDLQRSAHIIGKLDTVAAEALVE